MVLVVVFTFVVMLVGFLIGLAVGTSGGLKECYRGGDAPTWNPHGQPIPHGPNGGMLTDDLNELLDELKDIK